MKEKNKTVFLVSHNSNLSGAPISLAHLARKLPLFGYNPVYILPKEGPIESILKEWNIEYIILRKPGLVLDYIRIMKKRNPSIIHVNSLVNTWPVLISRFLRRPVVWHVREYLGNKKLYARLIHMLAHRIILISGEQYRLFNGMQKAALVPNGIDLSLYENIKPAPIIDKLINDVRTIITYVGTIEPRKGLYVLAQAAELLSDSPWIHFVVVGDAPERYGGYKKQVMDFIKAKGLRSRFHFLGSRKDVPEILAASDALCHPAFIEVFPRVILEAMAIKIPVIASKVGGITEMVENSKSGFLFEPGDFSSLARTIETIDSNKKRKNEMGKYAHLKVKREFSIEIHTRKIAQTYESLLNTF